MSGSHRDRAAFRASQYREEIAKAQAGGDFKGGADLALAWLRGELVKVRRRRPNESAAVDAELTEKLVQLAEAVPFFKPARKG
ncbi:hypothetical protein ACGFNU_21085 [Spirillospora sp. NPDC048911]|uniref:hypothetical protein n=1 Tax=Spirillospora sp. NPDC048911 TaxID=3364527 RepID=UPI00371998E2